MKNVKKSNTNILSYFKKQEKGFTKCSTCNIQVDNKQLQFHKDHQCVQENDRSKCNKKLKSKLLKNVIKTEPLTSHQNIETVTLDSDGEVSEIKSYEEKEISKQKSLILFDLSEDKEKENCTVNDLLADWESPKTTPIKEDNCKNSEKLLPSLPLHSGLNGNISDDDFQEDNIHLRTTPERKKLNYNSKTKGTSVKKSAAKNVENKLIVRVKSVQSLNGSLTDETSNTSDLSSICKESKLVSPIRTPTPSPQYKNLSQNFPEMKMSPTLKRTPNRFGLKTSISESQSNLSPSFKRALYKSPQKPNPTFPTTPSKSSQSSLNSSPTNYRNVKGMYLENFYHVIDTVTSHQQDIKLFEEEDLKILKDFHQLSLEAQKLYVRLFQRKKRWLRTSSIEYKDICDKEDIYLYVNELIYAEFLHSEKNLLELEEVLQLLNANELQKFCKEMKINPSNVKDSTIKKIVTQSESQPTITAAFFKASRSNSNVFVIKAKKIVGSCFKINESPWSFFTHLLMLYSPFNLNEDEERSQRILIDLILASSGKQKFPNVIVDRCHSIYQSRKDLFRLEKCHQFYCEFQEHSKGQNEKLLNTCEQVITFYEQLIEENELMIHDLALPVFLRCFTSISLAIYLLTEVVEVFQKVKDYQKAVDILKILLGQKTHKQDYRGKWYDRLALNLEQHLKKPRESLEVIEEAMQDPEVRVGHRLALSQRAQRILKSKKGTSLKGDFEEKIPLMDLRDLPSTIIQANSLPSDIPGFKRVYLTGDALGTDDTTYCCSVEELVISYFRKEGYSEGVHQEGRILHVLLGLYFWDIIYMALPDVFRTDHQPVPLDYNTPQFYTSRKTPFDQRLKLMSNSTVDEITTEMTRIWTENEGSICLFDWKIMDIKRISGLVASLGVEVVCKMCERLIVDHRFTRSGFPDIIVWNPTKKISRIVEVKGPNDRLSTKQMLWIDFLLSVGAVAEVCHVEALGAKREGRSMTKVASPEGGKAASPFKKAKKSPSPPKKRGKKSLAEEGQESSAPKRGRKKRKPNDDVASDFVVEKKPRKR